MRVLRFGRQSYSIPLLTAVVLASPADSTTYYAGGDLVAMQTTYAGASVKVPKSGVIKAVAIKVKLSGLASAELVAHSIRINDATDMAVGSFAYNTAQNVEFLGQNFNQAIAAGDLIALKIVTPVWATNPTNLRVHCIVFVG